MILVFSNFKTGLMVSTRILKELHSNNCSDGYLGHQGSHTGGAEGGDTRGGDSIATLSDGCTRVVIYDIPIGVHCLVRWGEC